MAKITAVLSLLIILVVVNWSILDKEKQLKEGSIVYLELAPIDPRSLIQGDYMALRFRLANDIVKALPQKTDSNRHPGELNASDGFVIVRLDERNIGSFQGLYPGGSLAGNEILMRYRVRHGEIKFATNAFFFQEGQGKTYQPARYGQFRVNDKGELLLAAMYDKELKRIEPDTQK